MKQEIISHFESVAKRMQSLVERFYWFVGTLVVPGLIAIFSVLAFTVWGDLYSSQPQQQLDIRVVPDAALSPAEALARLQTVKPRQQFETRLVEEPFWFLTEAGVDRKEAAYIEIPSRHLLRIACWNAANTAPIPMGQSSSDSEPTGSLMRIKAGHALRVDHASDRVLCRASFQGPAKLTAFLWSQQALEISSKDFHRRSGLLDGSILMLAAFVLITAMINRQNLYVIFAAWLVLTLRISTTAGGWDVQWLNHQVPTDWLPQMRSFTRALWAMLMILLLKALLRDELKKVRSAILLRVAEWMCLALLVAAFVLPRDDFILVMWIAGTIALLAATITLVNIVIQTRSMVAGWYCGSLTVTLLSNLSEIAAAALGIKQFILVFNTINGSFVSCLLAALAIAEQMRRTHRESQITKAKLQQTYDTIPVGMFTLDMQGRFTSINPALRCMLGQRATQHDTWAGYFGADVWRQLLDLVQHRQGGEIEFRCQMDVTGIEPPRQFLLKAALSDDTIEGSLQDVTEKAAAVEKLSFLADNDALTKVLNRRGIEKAFTEAAALISEERPLALAYLDMDRFKLINDLYGHNAGDEVLRQVCARIQQLMATHMKLGRVGGDEFVILLPDTRMPLATVIAQGIIDGIGKNPFRVGEKSFFVRVSIGLTDVSQATQFEDALTTADRACLEAKTGQHSGLVVYEHGSPTFREHQAELRLIGELSASETIDGLYIEMQPIMSLTRPSDALNFEVLLRMKDAAGEVVPAGRILAAAEDSGRMSHIDRWVFTTTLAWMDRHREQLKRTQFVCISLSGASLNDEEFIQEIFRILRSYSHVSGSLLVDISENVALHDLQNTRRVMDKLHSCGVRIALSDFGAGYSSFSYLKELPADLLKIDGSFVVDMNEHPSNVAIVEAMVNLARNLGMKTIAEWAEDTATVQSLAEIGVDYVQGYAVAGPMAPEKLLEGASSVSFIQDAALRQFAKSQDRKNNPLAQLELLIETDGTIPPKVH